MGINPFITGGSTESKNNESLATLYPYPSLTGSAIPQWEIGPVTVN